MPVAVLLADVTVELGRTVPRDELFALRTAGHVIVATGAVHGTLPFLIDDSAVVLQATDVLAGDPTVVPDGPVARSIRRRNIPMPKRTASRFDP